MTLKNHVRLIQLGMTVKRHRKQQNLTLPALAKLAGLPKSTISKIENGKGNPTLFTIGQIADALQIIIVI